MSTPIAPDPPRYPNPVDWSSPGLRRPEHCPVCREVLPPHLHLESVEDVLPGDDAVVTTLTERAFRPDEFSIDRYLARSFMLVAVKIGSWPQLAIPLPFALLEQKAIRLMLDTVETTVPLELTVRNVSAEARRFQAKIFGAMLPPPSTR